MKHIVCFSGGHSSGIVAIEVVRKYGNDDVILLNHDISPTVEGEDIKRFKREVADYDLAFYTGTESPTQKRLSKEAFINGETNLLIMSLRSGIGVDGLQQRCSNVVYGELDWSPKVHDQFTARVDRDGQQDQVTAFYLVSEQGSDPVIMDLLGLKASQAHGIVDPFTTASSQHSDQSRIKLLAESFLQKKGKSA